LNDAVRSAGRLDWRELVRTSLKAYLDILTEEPALAYVMHVEALIAGPALAGYRRRFSAMFADRMRAARNIAVRSGELTGELPSEIFNFIIGGIDDRIRDCLQQRGPSALQELEPTLTYVALTLLDTEPTGPAARIGKNWAR
ncbi:hypothetical protein OS122_30305, partial [Mycolicibacterium mucogenicum]|nr:hypothetical protein [Mycolicibacterium mucogenicum]